MTDVVEEVFEELNFPSLQKLKKVLDSRGIAYDKTTIEKLVKSESVRQVQAPTYKFDGKIASRDINDRWFCDLVDFTAAPSDRGKRTGLEETKEGEVYILVVQDVFSRFFPPLSDVWVLVLNASQTSFSSFLFLLFLLFSSINILSFLMEIHTFCSTY
jgi:hypothetical protein